MQRNRWYKEGVFALALAGALSLGSIALPSVAIAEEAADEEIASTTQTNEGSSEQGNQQAAVVETPTSTVADTTSGSDSNESYTAPAQDATPNEAPAQTVEGGETTNPPDGGEGNANQAAAPEGEGENDNNTATPTGTENEADNAGEGTESEANAAPADEGDALGDPEHNDPIADGTTLVIESGASGKEAQVFDAQGGKSADGTNIQMHVFNNTAAQKYTFEKVLKEIFDEFNVSQGFEEERDESGNLYYWIKRSGTHQTLTVVGETEEHVGKKGGNVALYEVDATLDGQKWLVLDMGNGLFKIVSKLLTADGKTLVLDVAGGAAKMANGSNVQVWTDNGSAAQRFGLLTTETPVSNVNLASGVFTVAAKGNTSFAADIESGSTANGANVRLWTSNGSAAQSMVITADGNGYYTIGILKSGKVFDVESGSMIPGANVRQWNYNGSDAQKWAIQRNDDGSYSFLNKKSGLLLDIAGGTMAKGTNLMVYRNTGSVNGQHFTLTRNTKADSNVLGVGDAVSPTGIFTISPAANTGFVFDVKSGSKNPGGLIQLWASNGSQAQKFQVELVGNNEYVIRTAASGDYLVDMGAGVQLQQQTLSVGGNVWKAVWNKGGYFEFQNTVTGRVIDVRNGSYAKGTAIQATTGNDKMAQRFVFAKVDLIKTGYYFVNSNTGTTLDIQSGSTANGANVRLWSSNKSDAQKFNIVKVGNYYQLINFKTNKAVSGGGANDGDGYANVNQQTTSTTNKKQLWKVQVGNDGFIEFVNVATGQNLFSRGQEKGNNVVEKDLTGKDYDDNINGRSWTLVAATGWFQKGGHWYYVSSDSRAVFENDVDSKGKSLGHYDILYTIWRYVNGKTSGSNKGFKSKTGYLICSSWDNAYIAIFKGKANVTVADNWEPLFGINCANGQASKIEAQARIDKPGSTWKWDPNWDKNLGEGNASIKNMPEGSEWAYSLGYKPGQSIAKGSYNWTHSRKEKVSATERWFTSVSTTLGYHTFTGKQADQVGRHISYGCQRVAEKYAKWIYDNIGPGTRCLQRTNKRLTSK